MNERGQVVQGTRCKACAEAAMRHSKRNGVEERVRERPRAAILGKVLEDSITVGA
jgi:hypothetical protein